MVQRSILSFFSSKGKKSEGNEDERSQGNRKEEAAGCSVPEDSPVKAVGRRKARVIVSDSEDDEAPPTPSPHKSDEEKENKIKEEKSPKPTPGAVKRKDDEEEESGSISTPSTRPGSHKAAKKYEKAVEECKAKKNLKPKFELSGKDNFKKKLAKFSFDFDEEKTGGDAETVELSEEEKMEVEESGGDGVSQEEDEGEVKRLKKGEQSGGPADKKAAGDDQRQAASSAAGQDTQAASSAAGQDTQTTSSTVGFTSVAVPPRRKTARKQMKRNSDGVVEKQLEHVKKLKEESNSKCRQDEAMETDPHPGDARAGKCDREEEEDEVTAGGKLQAGAEGKQEQEGDHSPESPAEGAAEHSKKSSADEQSEEKASAGAGKTPVSRPKPAAIHSFFAPRPGSQKMSTAAVEEEENCSSPVKQDRSLRAQHSLKIKSMKDKEGNLKKDGRKSTKELKHQNVKKEKDEDGEQEDKCVELEREQEAVSKEAVSKEAVSKKETAADKEQEEPKKPVERKLINPFAPQSGGAAQAGSSYNPGKTKYHPIDDAFWKKSERVPYLALAKTLELIEKTSGRLKTMEILANFLRSVIVLSPDDLLFCVYLCLNKVAPAFEGTELGVGETILMRSIVQASGRSMDKIKADVGRAGDLGVVAEQSRSNQRTMFQPAKLTLKAVFDRLREIALMTGHSVQNKKIDKIKGMYVACSPTEARYLIRSLTGKLRIGLAEQSVLQAVAQACFLTPPGQDVLNAGAGLSPDNLKAKYEKYGLILKTTYCEFPSYDKIIPVLLTEGLEKLPDHCQLTPGIPLKPMLAHPTTGVSQVLKRFENAKFTCEFKYDGERAQIHMKEDGTINIYSRNQENNTSKYPDIISRFKSSVGEEVRSCVLDCEAVAWDREQRQILPFQVLSTRKRKDAEEKEIKVQVCVFPFDLLYLNGQPLVRQPFERRRELLKKNFKEVEGEFVFAKSMDSTNTEDIEEFLEESIKGNCEGLMVKTLDVDATYEIAKRSHNWLKLKKDYLDGVGDTIDVVVIGGYTGKGKRAGLYGGFLLACHDPDNEEYQSLCKIGTGFTDEALQTHTAFFKQHLIDQPKSYYRYDNSVAADHWFEAVQVWEIKCADLSLSPVHQAAAGIVDPERGISLRFPRFLRIRDDKSPEDATSSSQIADLYNSQDQIKNKKGGGADPEEDFY